MKNLFRSASIRPALVVTLLVVLILGVFQLASAQKKPKTSTMRELVLSYPDARSPENKAEKYEDLKFTGPYSYKNLTIFLIHGPDTIKDFHVLTLAEALKEKKVRVLETGEVHELTVENLSKDSDIFIQSGDIVKGGEQDRLLACDLVVPASSGKMPIPSFCVESGRWEPRGNEDATQFDSSTSQLASKRLKLAGGNLGGGAGNLGIAGGSPTNQRWGDQGGGGLGLGGLGLGLGLGGLGSTQGEVWDNVGRFQKGLQGQLGQDPRSKQSPSSLQLTVEDKEVRKSIKPYIGAFSNAAKDKKDVIGFVFAINGIINSADIYASSELFRKQWSRLLEAAALEAFSEYQEKAKLPSVTAAEVSTFLKKAESGKPFRIGATDRIRILMTETDQCFYFQTLDQKRQDASIHRSYLRKLIEP